jgi:hypothetical protein
MLQLQSITEFYGKLRACTTNKQEVNHSVELKASPLITLLSTRPAAASASEEVKHSRSAMT